MRTEEWWRAGQVLMEVNAIPGLVSDKQDIEESYGDLHTMQSENSYFYSRETGHAKRDCKKFAESGERNPVQFPE